VNAQSVNQIINALTLGSVYALFALGLSLVWGVLDVLNLAQGALFLLGPFVAYEVARALPLPLVAVLPIAMVVTGLVSVVLEVAIFRYVRRSVDDRKRRELTMLITSIGAAAIITQVVANKTADTIFYIPHAVFRPVTYTIGRHVHITNLDIVLLVAALGLGVVLAQWVRRSRHGRALRAVAFDARRAGLFGVSADRLAALTLFVSGALAAAAGVLFSVSVGGIDSSVGDSYLLTAFAVVILGGVGSVAGTVVGAFVVAGAETAVTAAGVGQWQNAVVFGVILVVLAVRPEGLFRAQRTQRV
jgi:branched-chain amino acid transport system permease protein